jgi:hypothetical protein
LRRLLVFGTGAAVIGILLTVVAFYEAYLIVSSLQRDLASSINNQTLLLEDATLEAVFLGVMVALGYGLISKGLDGIRKQELLELELPAEEMLALEGTMSSTPREAIRAIPRRVAPTERVTKSKDVPSPSTIVQDRSATVPASGTASPPIADQQTSAWQPPTWHRPVEPEVLSEMPEPQMTDAPQYSSGSGKPSPSGEAVWEGGSSPSSQGTQVAAQSVVSGSQPASGDATLTTSVSGESMVQPSQADTVAPPKRKRGRPKGSKKSTKETAEETV